MTPQEFNAWRIWPRILTGLYSIFFVCAWFYVVTWFMDYPFEMLDNEIVALAVVGFPAAILTVISLVLRKMVDNYMNGPQAPPVTHHTP